MYNGRIFFGWHLPFFVPQICLNVQGKSNSLAAFDELFDMDNQERLREDCSALVGESKENEWL